MMGPVAKSAGGGTGYIPVFPAPYEANSLVGLEAMAGGMSAVATRVGDLADYLEDGVNGCFVEREPEDSAHEVLALLNDSERRQAMGRAARETAERFFWDAVCERYLELIHEVARLKQAGGTPC